MGGDRTRALLIVVAVLAALRFLIVPWWQGQNEARDQLSVVTERLDRSLGLIANREPLQRALDGMRADVGSLRSRFPAAANPEQMRIEVQRSLGALAAARGGQLRSFEWQLDGTAAAAGLGYGRVRLSVEGPLRELIRLHGAIEGQLQHAFVREVNVNVTAPATAEAGVLATASLVLDVFFVGTSS
jgi:hypothetical protein